MNHGFLTVSDTWIHQDQERYVIMDCTREDVHYAGFVKTATTEAKSAEFDAIVKEVKKAEKEAEKEAEKRRKEEDEVQLLLSSNLLNSAYLHIKSSLSPFSLKQPKSSRIHSSPIGSRKILLKLLNQSYFSIDA